MVGPVPDLKLRSVCFVPPWLFWSLTTAERTVRVYEPSAGACRLSPVLPGAQRPRHELQLQRRRNERSHHICKNFQNEYYL